MAEKVEYFITDGEKFVKQNANNQYKLVANFAIANSWDNAHVAKAILYNSVPAVWRNSLYVARYTDGSFVKWSLTDDEKQEYRDKITKQNKEKIGFKLDLYSFDGDDNVHSIINGFESVLEVLKSTKNLHLQLQEKLTTLDFVLEDLKHYQLKKKLGTVDAYKFKSFGDEIVLKRVSIKNQLEILYKINQHRSAIETQLKDICETINDVRNKTYVPRILVDLFNDGVSALNEDDYLMSLEAK